jgi:hypothetical protein
MDYLNKNKTIIVKSSPENSNYMQLKSALNSATVVDGLKQRDLNIVEDLSTKNNDFNFYLYGQDGSLFINENSYNNNTFDNVFSFVDGMTPKQSQSGGGPKDYQQKYFKYKNKYDELQSVITSFKSHKM